MNPNFVRNLLRGSLWIKSYSTSTGIAPCTRNLPHRWTSSLPGSAVAKYDTRNTQLLNFYSFEVTLKTSVQRMSPCLSHGISSPLPLWIENPSPFPSGQFPFIEPSKNVPIETPLKIIYDKNLPSLWNIEKLDPLPDSQIPLEAPTMDYLKIEKLAARLIRIRRRKMKHHQLTKLRKRMGKIWDKHKEARRNRRLKKFYEMHDLILKKAQEFDPEAYVKNYIATVKQGQLDREAAIETKENHLISRIGRYRSKWKHKRRDDFHG